MANTAPSMEVVNSSLQPHCEYPRTASGSPAMHGGLPNNYHHGSGCGGDLKNTSNHSSSGHGDTDHADDDGVNLTEDNWDNVVRPGQHDVLLGRGGGTNNHAGNVKFRQLVNEHKMRYLACSKVDKPKVAREVVQLWRQMDPPGRFLARKDETKKGPGSVKSEDNVWFEVGDKKANAKASQCLRERTPDVMPYLRQLREQQDLNTEHGVRLVRQHQMEMQEQYRLQGGRQGVMMQGGGGDFSNNPAFGGGGSPAPTSPYGRSASLSMPGPNGTVVMMSPNSRRMSMPSMAGAGPSSPYQVRGGDAGPQQAFYDEPGTPSSHGGGGVQTRLGQQGAYTGDMTDMEYEQHMMIMQQQLQMQQMQLQRMQQQRVMQRQAMTQQQQHLSCLSPMAIASPSKLGMQQQQQMQQQQMQQQRGSYSQQMQQAIAPPGLVGSNDITPQAAPSSPAATTDRLASKKMSSSTSSPTSVTEHEDPLPVDHDPLQDLTRTKANVCNDNNNSSPSNKKNKRSLAESSSRGKDGPATRGVPDRNPSFMSLGEEGELTLEEYRQQLEEYILNNQITPNENGGLAEEDDDDDCEDDEDDDKFDEDDASDLEDDWEKEKEKAYRHQQHLHLSPQRGRGLDRANTKSACSFMSVQTNSSMLSGTTNFSELGDLEMSNGSGLAHLDDADDVGVGCGDATGADNHGLGIKSGAARAPTRDRSRGVDRAVSGASMLSMMSELTDLSQNVDNLSLYDD